MHSEVCAGCGGEVGEEHVDCEQVSGVKKLVEARVTEQTYTMGLARQEVMETTTAVHDPVIHRFTLCARCVRERVVEAERARLRQPAPVPPALPPPQTRLWVDLTVVPAILAAVAAASWNASTPWIHRVALGAIPVWMGLVLLGSRAPQPPAPAGPPAEQASEAIAAMPFAQLLARPTTTGDLIGLAEAIVRTRGLDRSPINALERGQLDGSRMRVEVIRQGTPHSPQAIARRLAGAPRA